MVRRFWFRPACPHNAAVDCSCLGEGCGRCEASVSGLSGMLLESELSSEELSDLSSGQEEVAS